jgi:mono/diheme cytochrome c family protein
MKAISSLTGGVVLALAFFGGKTTVVHGAEQSSSTTAATAPVVAPAAAGATDDVKFYNEHVRPVLVQSCYKCHTDEQMGGLRVDSRAEMLKGGDSGPAIVPHDAAKSLLITAVQQTGSLKMPPKGAKLSDSEISDLVAWVNKGAETPANDTAQPATAALTPEQVKAGAGDEFFETNVRPVLVTECGSCHQAAKGGGLSIDSRADLLKGGDMGPAIVVGDPDKSLLIKAVHQDGDLRMPKFGRLSDAQIADLSKWIKMGAPWPTKMAETGGTEGRKITAADRSWWAFQPLHDYPVPQVTDAGWAKNDIDRYVLAKLEAKGLKPSAEADKLTLLRRVTLDLTGLPPTPQEVAAFSKDDSPNAYETVVDRLLASPRYGERWGRHWLDVARYGDDDIRGLAPGGNMPMNGAWLYRDWVIKAINNDMPYDQFVKLQLAGDLISKHPTQGDEEATGFLGGAPWIWDQAEPVQGRADERNERIDAVTRGMLGLTVACARCHDHKYDPILQRDYYALGGIFASSTYKEYAFVPDTEVEFFKAKTEEATQAQEQMTDFTKTAGEQMAMSYAAQSVPYMIAAWNVSGKPKMTVEAAAERAKLDPEVVDRWVKFLGKKQTFYPYLHDWQMMIAQGGTEDQAKELAETFQDKIFAVYEENKKVQEENDKIREKAGVKKNQRRPNKPNEFETYDEFCPGCTLELKVLPPDEGNLYTDLFVRSLSSSEDGGGMGRGGDPGLFSFRGWSLTRRLSPQEQAYTEAMQARIKKIRADIPDQYNYAQGIGDKAQVKDIPLDLRGNPHALGDVVPRAFPTVLRTADEKPYTQGSGRLQLADDIVASPLASRVFVNRVWKWHFGTGIVNTADNFGKVGDKPSDPELLDYLAVQFRKDGMSLKKLQKMIVMSATYQQASKDNPDAKEKDPDNRLYSFFPMQRLDAEQIRDSILFTAGDLNLKEPVGIPKELNATNTARTVYGKVSRFRIDPFLQAFDFPNPTFTAAQRFSTNVPVQRLFFMNSAFVYGQSGKLVDRIYKKADTDEGRITEVYHLLYGRAPSAEELQLGLTFLKTTPDKPGYAVDQEPETAWKQYARVLYSANEFEYLR